MRAAAGEVLGGREGLCELPLGDAMGPARDSGGRALGERVIFSAITIPAAPTQISRPATPVLAPVTVLEELTIAPTTFALNPVRTLPPPPALSKVGDEDTPQPTLSSAPVFTPFTVAPSVLNRDEVTRAMAASYPPILRGAGIGGTVRVYFFIDEEGRVQDRRVHVSSGHNQLDEAALAVAELYRFSPALNRDKKVPVWVLLPIEFRVR